MYIRVKKIEFNIQEQKCIPIVIKNIHYQKENQNSEGEYSRKTASGTFNHASSIEVYS